MNQQTSCSAELVFEFVYFVLTATASAHNVLFVLFVTATSVHNVLCVLFVTATSVHTVLFVLFETSAASVRTVRGVPVL